ncbi:helix-turn-helix domain-containing protein [Pseudomonas brassicacearum]|jgi:transcriptional regulator with XRE-family HTH domain|uniref:helix-turn-helix domain-containing protein n=1 Tax=Pseudomonas brassicacearum TaxID=930166 RepID=UPI000F469EF1|nr:XRE family transcriptional regulator [Pseudomonas brassicacearum]
MPIDNADSGDGDFDSTRDRVALGEEIRKLRKARSKTLAEISLATGRSISFISQLERGRAEIPISDLKRIALTLGVPLDWFFMANEQPAAEAGRVVRAGGRRRLGSVAGGLTEESLSPSIGGAFEMFLSTIGPGATFEAKSTRGTEEEGFLVSGQLNLWIGEHPFSLSAGDSFRIANEPYRWENPGEIDAVVIWVIAPPAF